MKQGIENIIAVMEKAGETEKKEGELAYFREANRTFATPRPRQ